MMERALKERVIGAVVIVLFVVLVVPVFLDGRSGNDEIVSERVPLPGQSEQKSQTIVLDRDRDEPVPAVAANNLPSADTPAPEVVEEKPEPAPAKQEPVKIEPKPEPEPEQEAVTKSSTPASVQSPPATVSTTGMWAVQIGAFSDQEKAERLAAELRKQGFAAFQSPVATDGGRMVRVRIGPQKDRESAEAMAERLAKAGRKGRVVPHP